MIRQNFSATQCHKPGMSMTAGSSLLEWTTRWYPTQAVTSFPTFSAALGPRHSITSVHATQNPSSSMNAISLADSCPTPFEANRHLLQTSNALEHTPDSYGSKSLYLFPRLGLESISFLTGRNFNSQYLLMPNLVVTQIGRRLSSQIQSAR